MENDRYVVERLGGLVAELEEVADSGWAWENYIGTVRRLITARNAREVIEVGGGRSPSFTLEDVSSLGIAYTSNDISERELAKAPEWVGKAQFDIQEPDQSIVMKFEGRYDLAFSRMVMEHVESSQRAYLNIHRILKPGGISIAFHPVLFATPFVLNKALPTTLSARLLAAVFPDRTDSGTPKFPAFYDGCVISKRFRSNLNAIGFSHVWQVPFYGHGYYRKLPVVRDAHAWITTKIRERKLTALAAYAFTIAMK